MLSCSSPALTKQMAALPENQFSEVSSGALKNVFFNILRENDSLYNKYISLLCNCLIFVGVYGVSQLLILDLILCHVSPPQENRSGLSALLRGTTFRFQLDELFGHLVSRTLGQDTHHSHARLVGVDARPERTPAHAALAVGYVAHLNDCHADHPVRPAEAVVLHRHLELVAVGGFFTQDAAEEQMK